MSDQSSSNPAAASSSSPSNSNTDEITINIKAPANVKLSATFKPASTSVLELKELISNQSEKPKENGGAGEKILPEFMRLIYSGRVLKDEDSCDKYGLKTGHTMHLVKGAARNTQSGSSSPSSSNPANAGVPQNIAAGQQFAGNPLAPLLNATNPGIGGFNPFPQLGVNQNDPNMAMNLLDNPEVMRQAAAAMQDPAMVDQVIAAHPQLAGMGPQIREIMQSPMFRNLMANPEMLRATMQMRMGGAGGGGGGPGAAGGFPPPGAFGWGSGTQGPATTQGQGQGQTPPTGAQTTAGADNTGTGGADNSNANANANPGMNPFGMDPNLLQQALQQMGMMGMGGGMGGMGGGGNPPPNPLGGFPGLWGGMGGMGSPPPQQPRDSRPPEERFETQLGQLREMGFTNTTQNVRALMATGGDVQSAIEYMLGGGGL